MSWALRQATAADMDALGALKFRASLAWGDHVQELQALPEARTFRSEDLLFAFIAEEDGLMLGFATVLPGSGPNAELEDLFVEPGRWRGGVGRRLVEEGCRRALAMGAQALHVIANPRALGFYAACGFEIVGQVQTRFAPAPEMLKPLGPA